MLGVVLVLELFSRRWRESATRGLLASFASTVRGMRSLVWRLIALRPLVSEALHVSRWPWCGRIQKAGRSGFGSISVCSWWVQAPRLRNENICWPFAPSLCRAFSPPMAPMYAPLAKIVVWPNSRTSHDDSSCPRLNRACELGFRRAVRSTLVLGFVVCRASSSSDVIVGRWQPHSSSSRPV